MTRTHDIAADMVLEPRAIDVLVAEIRHYLEAVELFRQELHEPSWRTETPLAEAIR